MGNVAQWHTYVITGSIIHLFPPLPPYCGSPVISSPLLLLYSMSCPPNFPTYKLLSGLIGWRGAVGEFLSFLWGQVDFYEKYGTTFLPFSLTDGVTFFRELELMKNGLEIDLAPSQEFHHLSPRVSLHFIWLSKTCPEEKQTFSIWCVAELRYIVTIQFTKIRFEDF